MTYLITTKNYICEVLRGVTKIKGLTEYRKFSPLRKKLALFFLFVIAGVAHYSKIVEGAEDNVCFDEVCIPLYEIKYVARSKLWFVIGVCIVTYEVIPYCNSLQLFCCKF